MSLFYQSLSKKTQLSFKKRKKAFKRGKPCAICGRKYPSEEMMVAHKKPVSQLSDREALYDQSNWEVRCIWCERRLNQEHDLQSNDSTNIIVLKEDENDKIK